MSVVVATVGTMTTNARTSTRGHACAFFDDGGLELLCACGERALQLLDEHGDSTLVVLWTEPSSVTSLPRLRTGELAVSA